MENQPYVVAVDSGKYLTKAILVEDGLPTKSYAINSLIKETPEKKSPISNRYVLTLNGQSTLMGAEDGIINTKHTKATDVHKRSTYLSLSQIVPNNSRVHLGIGTPLSIFKVAKETEEYKRFMLNLDIPHDEEIIFPVTLQFEVNEELFTYTIESLTVYAESSGYMITNEVEHLGGAANYVGVVDIGGLNINASLYKRVDKRFELDLTDENTFTADLGTNHLYTLLNTKITPVVGQLNRQQLETVLTQGFYGIDENGPFYTETKEIVDKAKKEYFDKIKSAIERWNFGMTNVVFIGGGATMTAEQIANDKDIFYYKIAKNAQWENVIGFALNLYDNVY